jgi:hypothetical protein
MRARTKTRKSQALDASLAFEGLGARQLPPVLTAAAVAKGLMPPLGISALPPSLEAAIPAELRYWMAKSDEEARVVRDELVERAVIRPADLLKVDGEVRRVLWQAFLAEEDQTPVPLAKRTDVAIAGATRLAPIAEAITTVDLTLEANVDAARVESTVKGIGERVCIALSDTPEHRAALSGLASAFSLATRPGVVYGSPLPLDPDAQHVAPIAPLEKNHAVRLLRKDAAAGEERYVFGVVLEPDVVDSQSDTYSAEEVRKAAHRFMELHGQLGKQHSEIVTGKLKILESYIAPVEFAVGSEVVKAGTWMLGIRVVDDALWALVKAGNFTGFSIGGTAVRQPDAAPTT